MTYARSLLPVDAAGAAALLLLSAGAYVAGLKPAVAARAAEAGERELLAQTWDDIAQRDRDLAAARTRLASTSAAAAAAVRLQPAGVLNQRLGEIAAAAEPSGASISEIVPTPALAVGNFQKITIRISGDASFPQAAALLRDLHRAFPDTEVTSLTLGGQPENPGARGRLSAELAWYVLPASKARSDPAAGAARPGESPPQSP